MPSIGVLEHFQKPTDKPSRRIKRSGGQSLVNRGMAVWVRENILLHMRPASAYSQAVLLARSPHDSLHSPSSRPYIPEKLPANIDAMLGVIDQTPTLINQVRFRHV